MSGAATTPGFGLQYVFGNKMKGAEEDCGDQGISFLPILSDSLGGWHNEQKERLGAALARRTGQEDGKAISHRWRRLAVLLQMNNAAILTGFGVEQLTVIASCSVQACTSCD